MDLYLKDFIDGILETASLFKQGQDIFSAGNGALFPNITSQAKWKYARTPTGLRITDSHNVWHFEHGGKESDENDFPLTRGKDISVHDFESGAVSKGLAQVHRADPGSIYFTIQEGTKNPTYTFKHEGGDNWRAIPKKRLKKKLQEKSEVVPNIEPVALVQGAGSVQKKSEAFKLAGILHDLNRNALPAMVHGPEVAAYEMASHPVLSTLGVAALGAGYDQLRRRLYNTEEENARETLGTRLRRVLLPAAAVGGTAAFLGGTKPGSLTERLLNKGNLSYAGGLLRPESHGGEWNPHGMKRPLFGRPGQQIFG